MKITLLLKTAQKNIGKNCQLLIHVYCYTKIHNMQLLWKKKSKKHFKQLINLHPTFNIK